LYCIVPLAVGYKWFKYRHQTLPSHSTVPWFCSCDSRRNPDTVSTCTIVQDAIESRVKSINCYMQIGVQNVTNVSRSWRRKKGFVSLRALQIQNKNL